MKAWLLRKIYQFEVLFALEMMEPGEKTAICILLNQFIIFFGVWSYSKASND